MLRIFWHRIRLGFVLIAITGATPAWPAMADPLVPDAAVERLHAVWNAPKLYEDSANPVIQSFALVGRYHGQYWSVDADQGEVDGWENRRIFYGFKSTLFRDFLVEVQASAADDFAPAYDGLYVAYVNWSPKDAEISASAGRLDYLFTGLERSLSSKRIATFERALLVNQLMPGEVFGLHLETTHKLLSFHTGLYSGSIEQEFTRFNGGFAVDFGLAYRLPLFFDEGTLHVDLLFQDGDPDNNAFEPYKRIASVWHQGRAGPFGLGVDVTAGGGGQDGRASVYGLTVLPTYDISKNLLLGGDKLQLALRYHFAESDGDNGLQLPARYEQEVTAGDGDSFHSLYAGLNYFLYGDRLKLMAAVEYSDMEDAANDGGDYQGWTYLAGLRLYF